MSTPEHGPGMQVRSGAVGTLKSENVCDPAQPLKSYPRVIVVTCSFGDTTKVIGVPWDVVPLHSPALRDGEPANDNGKIDDVHALVRTHESAAHHELALAILLTVTRVPLFLSRHA